MKKVLQSLCLFVAMVCALQFAVAAMEPGNQSRMLMTKGNKVVWVEDDTVEVQLVGVNPYAYNLIKEEELMDRTFIEAFDNWHSNTLRLPVTDNLWSDQAYKDLLVKYVKQASDRGKYIIVDLHNFEYIQEKDMEFWREAAEMFKNNPAVLFGLFNEPHSITWEQWRNGGTKTDDEGNEKRIYGHQELIEMIRDLGAKNIVLAGGLDWGYDLRGIVGEVEGDDTIYALVDQGSNGDASKAGNGIIYDTHIYPWKGMKEWIGEGKIENPLDRVVRDWIELTSSTRKQHPVLSGENGWDIGTITEILKYTPGYEDEEVRAQVIDTLFQEGQDMYHDLWVPKLYEYFYDVETFGTPINYTAWCFAPNSSPILIGDRPNWGKPEYTYPPSEFWGVYVKADLEKALGENLLNLEMITDTTAEQSAHFAVDGDFESMWECAQEGDKYITFDLGGRFVIDQWTVRHGGSVKGNPISMNTVDFALQKSDDGVNWSNADVIRNNVASVTERAVKPFTAQYVRLLITNPSKEDGIARICHFAVSGKALAKGTVTPGFEQYLKSAVDNGLVPPSLDVDFQSPITRGQFSSMAVSFIESEIGEITALADFSDTDNLALRKMGGLGIISGVGDGLAAPEQLLSREQAAVIVTRILSTLNKQPQTTVISFADADTISSWAVDAANLATGIVGASTGANMFMPKDNCTVEESIAIMVRCISSRP